MSNRLLDIVVAIVFFGIGGYLIVFPINEPFGAAPGKEALGMLATYLNSLAPGGEGLLYILASITFAYRAIFSQGK